MSDMLAMKHMRWWVVGALLIWSGSCLASASPGSTFLALSPAPDPGDFDVAAYCTDPGGFAGLATQYPDGWSAAYRSAGPPAGWDRPFIIRGGGPASSPGR